MEELLLPMKSVETSGLLRRPEYPELTFSSLLQFGVYASAVTGFSSYNQIRNTHCGNGNGHGKAVQLALELRQTQTYRAAAPVVVGTMLWQPPSPASSPCGAGREFLVGRVSVTVS